MKFELFLFSPLLPHLLHFDFQVRKDKLLLRVYNFSYGFCGCWKTGNALGAILARPTKNVNFSTAHMNNNVESSSKPPKMATTSFSTSHLFNWAYTIQYILVTHLDISLLAKKRRKKSILAEKMTINYQKKFFSYLTRRSPKGDLNTRIKQKQN